MSRTTRVSNREVIERFQAACAELEKHPYRLSGHIPTLHAVNEGGVYQYRAVEPDPIQLDAFIPRLRLSMSPNEPISVEPVRQLLEDILTDSALRRELVRIVEEWGRRQAGHSLPIIHNGQAVLPFDAWRLMVYGGLLHYNLEKRRELEELAALNVLWIVQLKFYEYIAHAADYVIRIKHVIVKATDAESLGWSLAQYKRSTAA